MAQNIVAGDLMVGACKLYTGVTITDSATDLGFLGTGGTPDFSSLTYQGLTDGGVQAAIQKSYANHTVDQSPDWIASTITERHPSISTNLATATLDKLKLANNGGTITTGVGTGALWDKWEPEVDVIENPETYISIVLYGRKLSGKKMITVMRRCLSVDNTEFAFTKDSKTMFSCSWAGHFVSDTVAPMIVYTQR
jgi:hypothetical protein